MRAESKTLPSHGINANLVHKWRRRQRPVSTPIYTYSSRVLLEAMQLH